MDRAKLDGLIDRFIHDLHGILEEEVRTQLGQRLASIKLEGTGKPPRRKGWSYQFLPRPCPITGQLNRNRRASYLMPEVNTPENRKRFEGWFRMTPDEMARLGVHAHAIQLLAATTLTK